MTRQLDIDKHIKRLNGTVKVQFSKNFNSHTNSYQNKLDALSTVYC